MKLEIQVSSRYHAACCNRVAQSVHRISNRPQMQAPQVRGIRFHGVEHENRQEPRRAKQKPTEEMPVLPKQHKRGYALGVELGSDFAKQGVGVNQHLVMHGIRMFSPVPKHPAHATRSLALIKMWVFARLSVDSYAYSFLRASCCK
jgi:hypothetical protein